MASARPKVGAAGSVGAEVEIQQVLVEALSVVRGSLYVWKGA
jgi:hypothetical protein